MSFEWGSRTYVFGILNVTPDSFSGDGVLNPEHALARALALRDDGADVIDVGGESTRPGHAPVDADEEVRRVEPVLRELVRSDLVVSIDTRKAAVARRALELGSTIVNDVSGFGDPEMAPVIAERGAIAILMDDRDVRGAVDPVGLVRANLAALLDRATAGGIPLERIVLDPGFGFGKGPPENLAVLRQLERLVDLGAPILVGTSRKSTIGTVLGGLPPDERLEGTAATVAIAIAKGAAAIRVHDVREMARVARMADAIVRGWRQSTRTYVGLGSNLGDRASMLGRALERLRSLGRVVATSSLYETEPWGKIDQPSFLNAVCVLETELEPKAVLAELLRIERELGRDRTQEQRWGPRLIDLDLLLYGDRVVRSPGLEVPHPGLHERAFALVPLAEVAPDVIHPIARQRVSELAARVDATGVRKLPYSPVPPHGRGRPS